MSQKTGEEEFIDQKRRYHTLMKSIVQNRNLCIEWKGRKK
jgi:hypothetical protein